MTTSKTRRTLRLIDACIGARDLPVPSERSLHITPRSGRMTARARRALVRDALRRRYEARGRRFYMLLRIDANFYASKPGFIVRLGDV